VVTYIHLNDLPVLNQQLKRDAVRKTDRHCMQAKQGVALEKLRLSLRILAKFCQNRYSRAMTTMNISLPDSLKSFVDAQVTERGYGTSSEYVRELIRTDQDRRQLRGLLLQGASSKPGEPVGAAYFDALRQRVARSTKPATPV